MPLSAPLFARAELILFHQILASSLLNFGQEPSSTQHSPRLGRFPFHLPSLPRSVTLLRFCWPCLCIFLRSFPPTRLQPHSSYLVFIQEVSVSCPVRIIVWNICPTSHSDASATPARRCRPNRSRSAFVMYKPVLSSGCHWHISQLPRLSVHSRHKLIFPILFSRWERLPM